MKAVLKTGFRVMRFGVIVSIVVIAAACSRQIQPIFEACKPPIEWPPAPAAARIRHVGQITSSADLKPPPKPFQALGELLLGRKVPSTLYGPRSVVCMPDGDRLWVADLGGRCLHLFNLRDRSYTKIVTVGGVHLLSPVALCLGPGDSIFVCDSEMVAIHRLSAASGVSLETLRLPIEVQRPAAACYDPTTGELFVVDVSAHNIKVLDDQARIRRIIGTRGAEPGQFNYPSDIAHDGKIIWIVDTGNHRVQGLTPGGEHVTTIGGLGDAPGDLALPKGIALDSDGHIYVVDARFENVQIFDRTGQLLLFFGGEGIGPGEFWLPTGIFIDAADRIWVCDSYNGRLQVFDYLKSPTLQEGPTPDDRRAASRLPSGEPNAVDGVRSPPSSRPAEVMP